MNENAGSGGINNPRIEFRRIVHPLPTGRVRVQIEVRQIGGGEQERNSPGGGSGRLVGRIVQVRGGWQFRPAGVGTGRLVSQSGQVWPTAEECKRSLQEWES
jgi:hypothetical protein